MPYEESTSAFQFIVRLHPTQRTGICARALCHFHPQSFFIQSMAGLGFYFCTEATEGIFVPRRRSRHKKCGGLLFIQKSGEVARQQNVVYVHCRVVLKFIINNNKMWQSTMVVLNDSTVPPGLPLPECVVPQAASPELLGTKRLHSDISFDLPCDSDDDTDSTASFSSKSLDDFFVPEEPTTNKKKRRRVTFGEHARVAQVERLERTCWYSRRDLFTMKAEAKRKSRELNLDSTLAPAYGMPLDNGRDEASLPDVVSVNGIQKDMVK